jgi:hypothetical protein
MWYECCDQPGPLHADDCRPQREVVMHPVIEEYFDESEYAGEPKFASVAELCDDVYIWCAAYLFPFKVEYPAVVLNLLKDPVRVAQFVK